MADDVDIPLTVSVAGVDRITALRDALEAYLQVANKALGGTAGVTKAFLGLVRQADQVQKALAKNYQVDGLNNITTAATKAGKAVAEIDLQKLANSGRALSTAAASNDINRVTAAVEVLGRKYDEARLKQETLSKAQVDGSAKGLATAKRQEAAANADLAKIEQRLAAAQGNLDRLRGEEGINRRVASRQAGVEVARRFEDTPEGLAVASKKELDQYKSATAQNIARDARELRSRQNLVRSGEVSAANAENAGGDRFVRLVDRANQENFARDASIASAKQRIERSQEYSAAVNEDKARNDQVRKEIKSHLDAIKTLRKEQVAAENSIRSQEYSAAVNEDKARNDQIRKEIKSHLNAIKTLRKEAGQEALLQDRAGQEDFRRNPTNIAAATRSSSGSRLEVATQLAQDPAYIDQEGKLLTAKRKLASDIKAAAGIEASAGETLSQEFGRRARVLAEYAALGLAFGAVLKIGESVLHLDNGLKELGAITGATATELIHMRDVIIATSVATPYASKQITELAKEMAQAGLSSHDIAGSLGNIALLASATGASLKASGEIFTSTFEVFKLGASDSARVADQFAFVLDKSRLGAEHAAAAIQTVSTTAVESGLGLTEFNAVLTSLANQGLRTGTLLSTGLRQIIVDLADPPKKLAARFSELGISLEDVNIKALGTVRVIENLTAAGFSTADAFAVLPARTAQAFAAFLKSGEMIKENVQALQFASGAAEQNAQRMESLENQAKRLGNQFIALTQTGAGPLIGVLKATASGLTSVTEAAGHSGTTFSVVSTVVAGVGVTALLKYIGTLGLATRAIEGTRAAVIALSAAQAAGAAVGGVAGGVGGAVAAGVSALGGLAFLGVAVAIAAGIAALGAYGNASHTLTAQQEELKTALNESRNAFEDKQKSVEKVNLFLEQTIAKEKILTPGSIDLANAVQEARGQFGQLSSVVYENITSFGGLIAKVQTLRSELRSGLIVDLQNFQSKANEGVANARKEASEALGPSAQIRALRAAGIIGPATTGGEFGQLDPNVSAVLAGKAESVVGEKHRNPEILRALRILGGGASGTPSETELADAKKSLERLPSSLKQQVDAFTQELDKVARPLSTARGNQQDADKGAILERGARVADSPEYRALETEFTSVKELVTTRLSGLRRLGSVQQRNSEGQAELDKVGDFATKLDEYVKRLPAADQAVFRDQDLAKKFAALRGLAAEKSKELNTALVTSLAGQAEVVIQRSSRELSNGISELRDTKTPPERVALIAKLKGIAQDKAEAQRQKAQEEFDKGSAADNPDSVVLSQTKIEREAAIQADLSHSLRSIDDAKARGGGSHSNPNRKFGDTSQSDKAIIKDQVAIDEKTAENDIAASKVDLAASSAFLDAARRNDQFPKSVLRQKQKEVNDLRIKQETTETEIRVTLNNRLQGDLLKVQEKVDENQQFVDKLMADFGLKVDKDNNVTGTNITKDTREEVLRRYHTYMKNLADLEGENGLGGEKGRILGLIDQNNGQVLKLKAEVDARSQTGTDGLAGVNLGFQNAVEGFAQKSGLNDPTSKAAAEGFTTIINKADSSFATFIQNLASGSVKGKGAFKDFVTSILKDALKLASEKASAAILGQVLSLATSALGAYSGGLTTTTGGVSVDNVNSGGFGLAGPETQGFSRNYNGGIIRKRFAAGGIVGGVHYGRDTVPAMLAPGEGVLSRNAVSLIGEGAVARMNSGAMRSQAPIPPPLAPRQPDNVNVYIVDKNTQPSLGPKDILAAVHSDILQGGATKALIKQVSIGQI